MFVEAGWSGAISTGQIRLDSLYIVHVDSSQLPGSKNILTTPFLVYNNLLRSMKSEVNTMTEDDISTAQPVHVYRHALHGFSARLTDEEVKVLRNMKGVLGVHPDRVRQLHTTHTPEFLGLSDRKGLWPVSDFGNDVIVGLFDTGIWPESASFHDEGMGPIPSRWKGMCQADEDFSASHCNKKLIGARFYSMGYEQAHGKLKERRSVRDVEGHGSHTSSTAAGAAVRNASLYGLAEGTARGMATKARIAMYKVCWEQGCYDSDLAAAFDQAVADGVDIISLSVGGGVFDYAEDAISIGAFGAMMKGIFVSCSAGNSGPQPFSVANIAPWIMTVGASTVDRKFPASIILGNGSAFPGASFYGTEDPEAEKIHALVYGGHAALKNATDGAHCETGSLNPKLVKGKIVVCVRGGITGRIDKGVAVKDAGGFGMLIMNSAEFGEELIPDPGFLPSMLVSAKDGAIIMDYVKSTKEPVARFKFSGTQFGAKPAPAIAEFSSRGPSPLTPQLLKPDITAPGVYILAAWTGVVGPTTLEFDHRKVAYNMISGTSMSCPHISGLGALLKGAHPHWSPAAIKSAMMTTASFMDNSNGIITDAISGEPADPFMFGSGHVRSERALSPGLVYDMGAEDYVHFLCALGYSYYQIKIFAGEGVECPLVMLRVEDLNYPSFSAVFNKSTSPITFKRTVTNVGYSNSTYKATVHSPNMVSISVHPKVLSFSEVNEKQHFTLTVMVSKSLIHAAVPGASTSVFGSIQWSDGRHIVNSPIAITVQK